MTLEELIAKRDSLLKIIANGNRRLQNGDQSIEYVDTASLKASIATLDAEIAKAQGSGQTRVLTISMDRGLR
jgi:hypothetical protein